MGLYPRTIQLLISLNKNEYDEFRDYLKSPYHNKIDILLSLFNLIIKKFQIQKETYCEVDLLNEAYDKPNLSTYKSHLQKLKKHFENFVMLQQIEKEENLYNQLVLEDYLHRKNGIFLKVNINKPQRH